MLLEDINVEGEERIDEERRRGENREERERERLILVRETLPSPSI